MEKYKVGHEVGDRDRDRDRAASGDRDTDVARVGQETPIYNY